jgi:hypothetical protein
MQEQFCAAEIRRGSTTAYTQALGANLQQSLAGMDMRITGMGVWQAALPLPKALASPVLCGLQKQQCTQAAQVAPHDSVAHR